jgi:hypothetical protein
MMLADDVHRGEPIFLRLRFSFQTPKVELETTAVCEGQPGGSGLKCYVIGMGGELDVSVEITDRRCSPSPSPCASGNLAVARQMPTTASRSGVTTSFSGSSDGPAKLALRSPMTSKSERE